MIDRIDGVPQLNTDRLFATLARINAFGFNPASGGYDRPAFSEADMAARHWFHETMVAEGLATHMDPAGNVFGRMGPAGPAVMVGSHLDTVSSGGAFDGALGCAVALECARAVRETGLVLRRPLEVVATADEEGRFGGMLGSQAIAGTLPDGWVECAADADGTPLAHTMRTVGLNPASLQTAARAPGTVQAFIELHIEQGPVLEAAGADIGIATGVSGCCVLGVTLYGVANHSGTTPMDLRRDAFLGLSRIGCELPALARNRGSDQSRLTIGRVALAPNTPHTIPGSAEFTVVIRDVERTTLVALRRHVETLIDAVARDVGLRHTVEERSWLDPVTLDVRLQGLIRSVIDKKRITALSMPSGAGHDAQTMASLCPSALVFVPSRDGISHAPAEHTPRPAIERGASVVLETVTRLVTDTC